MSPIPDPHTQLRSAAFAGRPELERPILELTGGPWRGRVVVRRYRFLPGRGSRGDRFAVNAQWVGPPMNGFPPTPAIGERDDMLLVDELTLAKAVAHAALEQLRAGHVPDLRALAADLKRRK